ncbi:MAG: hypothetical protein LBE33_11820 [Zoogloeaceae bacterium]|jgi:hypothetical protein|nr:hypothetical protein [Zoogloeaceae bacterium]
MRRRTFLALLAGAAITGGVSGCSTTANSAASSRGTGVRFSYAAPFEKVWAALPEILRELGMKITREDMAEGYVVADPAGSTFGTGVSALIYVEPIGTRGNSRVEVVSKGTLGINFTDITDEAKSIHGQLAQRFKRL